MAETVKCDYCDGETQLVGGDVIYPHRGDLGHKKFYVCFSCKAYVGCHPGTSKPLGRLADAELRAAKSAAHSAFDPLWKRKIVRDQCSKRKARGAGYKWLAEELGISVDECHIGMFDIVMCQRVVQICTPYLMRIQR